MKNFNGVIKLVLFFLLFSLFSLHLFGLDFDFNLSTNQYIGVGSSVSGEDTIFEYIGNILPGALFLFGNKGSFKISADLSFGYEEKEPFFVFDLLNTEYSVTFGGFGIKAGRIYYANPLEFIAEGLFDGIQATHSSPLGSFGLGVMYTGLLYKKTANIFMTEDDIYSYAGDNYFASRRLLVSLDWAHLSFLELLRLQAAATMQFDLNDTQNKLNSQYFTIKAGMPISDFLFELGGSIEPIQQDDNNAMAFAWETGVYWTVPTPFRSRLSFTGYFAGGKASESIAAFKPVTAKYYGDIFQPVMSGMSVLSLDYSARINQPFTANACVSFFVRNDLVTYADAGLKDDGYFMGTEIFGRLNWAVFSDFDVNFGAGFFVPGGAWETTVKPKWRIELLAVLELY